MGVSHRIKISGQMAALDLRASEALAADPYGMRRGKDAEVRPDFWPQPMGAEDWSLTKEEEVRFLFVLLLFMGITVMMIHSGYFYIYERISS